MSAEERQMLDAINNFREVPVSINSTIQKFLTAYQRLNSEDNSNITSIKNLKKQTKKFPPTKPLKLNDELSEVAKNCLNKYLEEGAEEDQMLTEDQCQENLPKGCPSKNSCIVMLNSEYPELTLIKMLQNTFDPEKKIKNLLTSDDISQVGISIKEKDDDSYAALVFAPEYSGNEGEEGDFGDFNDDEIEEKPEKTGGKGVLRGRGGNNQENKDDMDGLGELWKAFKCLDFDKNNSLRSEEINEELNKKNVEELEPTIYQMLYDLNNGKQNVSWEEFKEYFTEKFGHKETKEGRKDIYESFKNDPKQNDLDYEDLQQINEYLKLGYSDKWIKEMITNATRNKHGISYYDYSDRVDKCLEEEKQKEE